MNEQDIERLARRLGVEGARAVDPERTSQLVVARLRSEGVGRRPPWTRPVAGRIAAAAGLVMAVGLFALRDREPADTSRPESLATAVQGIETLEPTELVEVLDSLAVAGPVTSLATTALNDLTAAQLEELLERMEGRCSRAGSSFWV